MKVVIYNDCDVGTYKHFGCELVIEAFKDQLKRVDCNLVGTVTKDDLAQQRYGYIKKTLDKADLVVVNGEGSFHSNRRNDIHHVAKNWPSILVNSVYQNNSFGHNLKYFKFISCRESFSARQAAHDSGAKIEIIPDIIFTNKRLMKLKLKGTHAHVEINHFNHGELSTNNDAQTFLKEIVKYKSITSISFHSLIIAIMLGQDIKKVLPTNTHKNDALMHDYKTIGKDYVSWAQEQINSIFDRIHTF